MFIHFIRPSRLLSRSPCIDGVLSKRHVYAREIHVTLFLFKSRTNSRSTSIHQRLRRMWDPILSVVFCRVQIVLDASTPPQRYARNSGPLSYLRGSRATKPISPLVSLTGRIACSAPSGFENISLQLMRDGLSGVRFGEVEGYGVWMIRDVRR